MARMNQMAAVGLVLAGCGGADDSMPNPWHGTIAVTSVVAAGVTTCAVTETVTLTSTSSSPSIVSVPGDGCVTFVNDDNAPHQPSADSHPIHGCLPTFNPLGTPAGSTPILANGQSFTTLPLGAGLGAPITCGWHDHLNPPGTTVDGGGGGY